MIVNYYYCYCNHCYLLLPSAAAILMYQMCIDLKDCVPNSRIITYMFDGFVALPPPGYDAASIDIALANFQEIFGMVWEQGKI